MEEKAFAYIFENMDGMSKGQRKIADFICSHIETAAYMTAAKLAHAVGVSESTVVRFAYGLGYGSYHAFQDMLRETAKAQITPKQRMKIVSSRMEEGNGVFQDVLKSDMEKIQDTMEETDIGMFQEAVQAFLSADRIYILGVRSSESLAVFAGYYFHLLFDHVRTIKSREGEDMIEELLRVGENDVVLGISFPRYSTSVVQAMRFAKIRGARVIALTDSPKAPICEFSDCRLFAKSDMDSFADSLVAPMSLLNALICDIMIKKKEQVAKTMDELETIWDQYNVYSVKEYDHIKKNGF